MFLNLKGDLQSLKTPIVMGVLNCTDDSFYAGSRFKEDSDVIVRATEILTQGGVLIDLGAVSTRPGSHPIDAGTEYMKIKKYLKLILKYIPHAKVSVDTFRSNVAEMAIGEGAAMINDVSGGEDKKMFKVVAQNGIPYCLTHNSRGKELTNEELLPDMLTFFGNKVEQLKQMGANDIILDPGFGFGKSIDQNFYLMKNLAVLHELELPLLVGISRKSMIYKSLDSTPEHALAGTIALNTIAVLNHAHILRVHDVKEALDTIVITEKCL
jgi:dihydropteroate synthase